MVNSRRSLSLDICETLSSTEALTMVFEKATIQDIDGNCEECRKHHAESKSPRPCERKRKLW